MKWIIIILIILIMQSVYAEQGLIEVYKPNQVFGLSVHVTNETGDFVNANCSVQIRNTSQQVVLNDVMKEIGNGWYNYTYNTSQVGKYFCRQNCTQGDRYGAATCDFIIQGDNEMAIAISLILIFGIIFFMVLGYLINYLWIRILFLALAASFYLITISVAVRFAKDFGLSNELISLLLTVYTLSLDILIFVFVTASLVTMVYYIKKWIESVQNKKSKDEFQ